MTEARGGEHPDLDRLAEFAAGLLPATETSAVDAHLEACPLCRLELKRLARFETIDGDEELLAEAEWPRAEFLLQKAFAEKVRPVLTGRDADSSAGPATGMAPVRPISGARSPSRRSGAPRLRWLVPAAAAAVLILLVANLDRGPHLSLSPEGPDLLRGGDSGGTGAQRAARIELVEPLGEVSEAPRLFTWQADSTYDTFALTVFTSELATVFQQEHLAESHFGPPDSLRALLAPDRVYAWSVKAYAGLAPAVVSPSGWFRIVSE
jgi:hypothetical protein